MRPFKQGKYSRYCSVYSTLNCLQLLGLKLTHEQWQELYDSIIECISRDDELFAMNVAGVDHIRLENIFEFADKFLKKKHKLRLKFERPFWNQKLSLENLISYIQEQQSMNKTVLLRVRSNTFDHYSIFDRIDKTSIKFFDSDSMSSLILGQIATDHSKKHQIMLRQVYVLELCK